MMLLRSFAACRRAQLDGTCVRIVVICLMSSTTRKASNYPSDPIATPRGWEQGGRIPGLAAVGAVFALPVVVDAGIVYSGLQNLSIVLPVGQRPASDGVVGDHVDGRYLDLDGDLVSDVAFAVGQDFPVSDNPVGFAYGLINGGFAINTTFASGTVPLALSKPLGAEIGSVGDSFSPVAYLRFVEQSTARFETGLAAGSPQIVGVSFDRAGETHFGWLRLLLEDGPNGFPISLTVVDWAWNDQPLASIRAGDVPEANSALALLAAGGTALAGWRLNRRSRTSAAVSETAAPNGQA